MAMSIAEVYERYKHLDSGIIEPPPNDRFPFQRQILFDLWQAVKQAAQQSHADRRVCEPDDSIPLVEFDTVEHTTRG